jgi:hypothetical protein
VLCADASSSPAAPPISDPTNTWLQFPIVFSSVSQVGEDMRGWECQQHQLLHGERTGAKDVLTDIFKTSSCITCQPKQVTGIWALVVVVPSCQPLPVAHVLSRTAAVPRVPLVAPALPVQGPGGHQVGGGGLRGMGAGKGGCATCRFSRPRCCRTTKQTLHKAVRLLLVYFKRVKLCSPDHQSSGR